MRGLTESPAMAGPKNMMKSVLNAAAVFVIVAAANSCANA